MEPGAWEESRGAWFQGRFSYLFPSVVCSLQPPSIRFMDLRFERSPKTRWGRTHPLESRPLHRPTIPSSLGPFIVGPVRHRLEPILTDLDYAEFHPLERSRGDGVPSRFGRTVPFPPGGPPCRVVGDSFGNMDWGYSFC